MQKCQMETYRASAQGVRSASAQDSARPEHVSRELLNQGFRKIVRQLPGLAVLAGVLGATDTGKDLACID